MGLRIDKENVTGVADLKWGVQMELNIRVELRIPVVGYVCYLMRTGTRVSAEFISSSNFSRYFNFSFCYHIVVWEVIFLVMSEEKSLF